jgi:hypothetical protein
VRILAHSALTPIRENSKLLTMIYPRELRRSTGQCRLGSQDKGHMASAKVGTAMQQQGGNLRLMAVDTYEGICVLERNSEW